MKKQNSIVSKMSVLLTAFAVCVLATCFSITAEAAAGPLKQSTAYTESYETTRYVYLEAAGYLGDTVDLTYSTSDPKVTAGTATQALLVGTQNGKYIYIVKSTFAPGSTAYLKYQTTDAFPVATAPSASPTTISQINATGNSATIQWSAVTGATGYELYVGSNANDVKYVGVVNTNSYTLQGLAVNTEYAVMILPCRANGQGVNVAWVYNAKVKEIVTAPSKITGVKYDDASPKTNQYKISWSETGATTATGFEILVTNKNGKKIASATETSYISTVFKNSKMTKQPWKVKVRAYVLMDNGTKVYGAWSKEKVVVPYAKIKKAKLVQNGSGKVKLTWQKITGAKNYTIYKATSPNGKYKKVKTVKGTSYTLNNIPYYKYQYIVIKANGVKVGGKKYKTTNLKKQPYYGFQIVKKYY